MEIAISISHFWNGSDISIAILFDTPFDTPSGVFLLQFNCNLNATAADTSQPVPMLLASRVLSAAQQRH